MSYLANSATPHSLGNPPTDVVYAQLCKRHRLTPSSEVLEDGTQAHWIGPSSAEKVIINFHGMITISPLHDERLIYNRWWIRTPIGLGIHGVHVPAPTDPFQRIQIRRRSLPLLRYVSSSTPYPPFPCSPTLIRFRSRPHSQIPPPAPTSRRPPLPRP